MDVQEGISVDSLRWVTNAEMQKAHLEELYPFIQWDVQVNFLDIDANPMWNTTFWNYAYVDENGTTIVDGGAMFDAIYDSMRPQYVDVNSDDIEVFGVVFIKQQMEMHVYGGTYTGLGGREQTVIWKSWERYYRPDGVTPKDGISAVQLHETMHAIGFHHSWQHEHYSSDFSYGPMGYLAYHNDTASFDKNWVQGTYLDQMHAILWDEFTSLRLNIGTDERPEIYFAEQKILGLFTEADNQYNVMDWSRTYESLSEIELWIFRLGWAIQDNTAPVIINWVAIPGISTSGFQIQAQVSDDLSDLENVTVYVQVDTENVSYYPCTLSGNYWYATIPTLSASNRIDVWIIAWDWAMNRAESNHVTSTIEDPIFLFLIIGAVSIIVVVVIVVVIKKRS